MKKEELIQKIESGEIVSMEKLKSLHDFDVVRALFNNWAEIEAMTLATAEEQHKLLGEVGGKAYGDIYAKIAPYVKADVWKNRMDAYCFLAYATSAFPDIYSYVEAFKSYVKYINMSSVGLVALDKLSNSCNSDEKYQAYWILYLILNNLSVEES